MFAFVVCLEFCEDMKILSSIFMDWDFVYVSVSYDKILNMLY